MPPVQVCKTDDAAQIVFGWASVAIRKDGEAVTDWQGDILDPAELEHAAYNFVLDFREANEQHAGPAVGHLVESLVVTKEKLAALGLSEEALPLGWWVGFHLPDAALFAKVAGGEYRMFSIEGTANREEVAE